ncbi:MAG TPA: S53 family peptidase [Caulobacteraceae bacterium]|nr:S53 family peptidase [Caulobacteraceae bacterium]
MAACLVAVVAGAVASAQIFTTGVRVFATKQGYNVMLCGAVPTGYARCFSRMRTDHAGAAIVNRLVPNRFERQVRTNIVPDGYGPGALILAYTPGLLVKYPNNVGSPKTTIAIVDAYGYVKAERDLRVYRTLYGLPPCTTANGCFVKLNQNGQQGNYPAQDDGWAGETALDLQMASAMCPRCKIMLVEANTPTTQNLSTAVNTAVAKGANVVSNSYGGGEQGSSQFNAAYHHDGVAIVASTGDDGFDNQLRPTSPQTANFPASSQHVTAAGGTSLYYHPAVGYYEYAWSGGGSGCSSIYPKPAWQHDQLCAKRMEADVSAVADPDTGVAVYAPTHGVNSAWTVIGGTSVASPLIAGIYGAKGGPYTNGSLYKGAIVYDVPSGSNGSCGGTYFCNAGRGYDGPTGIGSPRATSGF